MVAAATILAESDHADDASRLIEFLLSDAGQGYFASDTFEYPLVPGVAPSADLPPLEDLEVPDYDIGRLGGDLRQTAQMISASGLAP